MQEIVQIIRRSQVRRELVTDGTVNKLKSEVKSSKNDKDAVVVSAENGYTLQYFIKDFDKIHIYLYRREICLCICAVVVMMYCLN